MTQAPEKAADSAEKAYAEAVADVKPANTPEAAVIAPPVVTAPVVIAKPTPPKAKKIKATPKKAAAKRKAVVPAAKPARAPAPAKVRTAPIRKVAAPPRIAVTSTVSELKEKIMASAKTTDFSKPISDALGEMQTRAKVAYEKSTEAVTEMTDFAKGNVEAIVESGKIFAGGAQDLGKTYVEEAKSAYETLTGDLKEIAAIKSPAELFQLQGKIMRRNFDALVATGSKNTEAVMKLANEAFAPITGRVNVAAEKLAKVA